MDGPKRLAFTTLDPVIKKSDKDEKLEKTLRLEVDLLESTDTAYLEVSYTDLVKSTTGGDRNLSTNSEDPFHDDEDPDRLAAIAKHFEDKYNKPGEGKKKKKRKLENHYMYELGDGYDENDTFIDNSEAYDEIMPDNMTTKLGGFYINSGRLSLTELSDDSEEEFQPETVKKTKKRRISSDDDSASEEKKKVVKKKKMKGILSVDGEVKVKKKKKKIIIPGASGAEKRFKKPKQKKKMKDSLSVDGEIKVKKKKKKIIPPGAPGADKPFKKPKQVAEKEKKRENKSSAVSALIKSTSPNLPGEGQENGVHSPTENGEPDDLQSITDAIEAVVAASRDLAGKDDSNSQDDEEPKKEIDPESVPKLPPNLPAGLEGKIEELKNQAKETRDGKCKFFTTDVNKLLLDIEITSKQMSVGNRSAMFGHLAAYLPCSKDTLMKRAKGLRVKDLEDKIKEPIEKLKKAVDRRMPELQEKYNEECKKFAQEKQANEQKVQEKDGETNKEKEGNQTESDEDETKTNQSEGTKKRQTGPRKKFEWDSNTRMLLCDVVRVKMLTFHFAKARSETAEDFCKAFLDKDVRPLWPKGWMQKVVLFKESRPAHVSWTNPQKPKKTLLGVKLSGATPSGGVSQKPGSVSSAPSSIATSKLNANKTVTDGQKSTPQLNAGTKPHSSAQNTPVVGAKKITPTLLNYDKSNIGNISSQTNNANSNNQRVNPLFQSAMISNVSPKSNTKQNDPKHSVSPGHGEKSWDHVVSDILRSSFTPSTKTSPPKPNTNQPARPLTSPSSGFTSSSFLSQFEQFAKSASRGPDSSPNSQARMQLLQKQLMERLNSERREEALKQLMMLQKQTMNQAKSDAAQKQQQQQKMGGGQQKMGGGQQKVGGGQPKVPSQSPMSMAMGRNPSAQIMTPKQLSNVFQKSPESASIAENVIRQQLNDSSHGNFAPSGSSPNSLLNKYGAKQSYNKPDNMYTRVSMPDQLRKSSPQVSPTSAINSQSKQGQGHVKVTTGQGQVLHNPSMKTVTTNGKPSQSLFNIPQSGMSVNNTVPSASTSPAHVITIRRPGTVSPAGSNTSHPQTLPATNLPNFMASNTSKPQGYPGQNPSRANIRLPTLTNQQIAMFKEVAKQQQQQHQMQQQQQQQNSNRPLTDSMK